MVIENCDGLKVDTIFNDVWNGDASVVVRPQNTFVFAL